MIAPPPLRRASIVLSAALALGASVTACSSEEEASCPASPRTFAYQIAPDPRLPSPYVCNDSHDWRTEAITDEINAFWGSPAAKYCKCDQELLDLGCQSNAFVIRDVPGHVYYDSSFLVSLATFTGGGDAAAAWVLAHEMGHNIQLRSSATTEPGADCLAGYFIQASVCAGKRGGDDAEAAFATACTVGDPTWFRGGTHGTCQQRITAVHIGMDGYRRGADPLVVCR
jgi:hypothetical protein